MSDARRSAAASLAILVRWLANLFYQHDGWWSSRTIWVVALAGPALVLSTAEVPAATEAEKAEAAKRIMTSRKFQVPKGSLPFCRQFLEDFRAQKDIDYIEPLVKTNDYEDAALAPYKARCPELRFNERLLCEPSVAPYLEAYSGNERLKEARKYCQIWQGTANFKLYRLDINNNPQDGKADVVYFERSYGPVNRDRKGYADGGYTAYNLEKCESLGGAPTHDPFDYARQEPIDNYNAIVRYHGEHYIFDLYRLGTGDRDNDDRDYRLHLWGFRGKESFHSIRQICAFSTIFRKHK